MKKPVKLEVLVERYEDDKYVVIAAKVTNETYHVWVFCDDAPVGGEILKALVYQGTAASLKGAMSLGMTLGR